MAASAPAAPPPDASSICVVSIMRGATYERGPYPGPQLLANKRAYCAACGYTCLLHAGAFSAHGRTPGWDKLRALDEALFGGGGGGGNTAPSSSTQDAADEPRRPRRNCSLALWLDADVVVLWPVALAPVATKPIVATKDYHGLNTGVRPKASTARTHTTSARATCSTL